MKVLFAESSFWANHKTFTLKYEATIREAFKDARRLLHTVPEDVTFTCQTSTWETIPETGEGAFTRNAKLIILSLDPGLPFGEAKVLKHVRAAVFHELNHAARYNMQLWTKTFIESAVMEGLATVFERDYAKADKPLWGNYKLSEVKAWVKEVDKDMDSYEWGNYMYKHPDGRRWMGYKIGTWLVDEAIKRSGKTVIQLTKIETKQIIKLAEIE